MKRGIFTLTALGLFLGPSCSNRTDGIFSASDEIHYIHLYERANEFELCYNGFNTAAGTYTLQGDTIRLTYLVNQFEEFDPNEELTRKILIDNEARRVRALDDKMQFCARIYLDKRKNQP